MSSGVETVPVRLRVALWSLAIGLALVGIVLSVVMSSLWPLVAFLGLGVPMLPVGMLRTGRAGSARSRES